MGTQKLKQDSHFNPRRQCPKDYLGHVDAELPMVSESAGREEIHGWKTRSRSGRDCWAHDSALLASVCLVLSDKTTDASEFILRIYVCSHYWFIVFWVLETSFASNEEVLSLGTPRWRDFFCEYHKMRAISRLAIGVSSPSKILMLRIDTLFVCAQCYVDSMFQLLQHTFSTSCTCNYLCICICIQQSPKIPVNQFQAD